MGDTMKLILIGDGGCGKTALLISYKEKRFPDEYVPTVVDNFSFSITMRGGKKVTLEVWDTTGQETYEDIRRLVYGNTGVVIVCYDVVNRRSFNNLENLWVQELMREEPDAPFIICGNKLDLRAKFPQDYVSRVEAEKMRANLGAYAAVQCSALFYAEGKHVQGESVVEVFKTAIRCGLEHQLNIKGKKGKCMLM